MKQLKKFEPILFGVLMAAGMSFIMSLAMMLIKAGIPPNFLKVFLGEWALGFAVSLLPSLFLPPLISKLLSKWLGNNTEK